MVIADKLGAGGLNDAFVAAFRLANVFRNIFAEGALNVVFVPEFSQILKTSGKKQAFIFAAKVHSLLLVVLAIFCLLAIIMMPEIIWYTTPGFREDTYIYNLAVLFGRITFPYLFCISLAAFYGGILNTFNKFFPFAIAPALLNIISVIGLCFFDQCETSAHTLSMATLIGGVFELAWMIYFLFKHGCKLSIVKFKLDSKITRVLKNMLPIVVASGVTHINACISMIVLSYFPGGLSYMYYADRIVQLPLALIGTAIGTVLLPMLAKTLVSKQKNTSLEIQNGAISLVMFLAIPATAALLFLGHDIIEVLFERGNFPHSATIQTAKTLMLLSIGLPAFVLIKLFQTQFYSKLNTKLPVVIAIISICINLIISLLTMNSLQYLGVAVANSVSGWVNFILLLVFAKKNLGFNFYPNTLMKGGKYVVASVVMVLVMWGIASALPMPNKYLFLGLEITVGLLTYLISCYLWSNVLR